MKTLLTIGALAATTLASSAALYTIDNYSTEQNGATDGAVGDFAVQQFTADTAGLGALDTVAANSPLPTSVYLNSVSFLRATSGTSDNAVLDGGTASTQTFVHVYLGNGDGGTYVGSSLNSIDTDAAAGLSTMTWNFGSLELTDSTAQYAFVFTNSADDAAGSEGYHARLQVARDSGGGFGNSYAGGGADNNNDGLSTLAYDTRFSISLDTTAAVPEPSSTALLGLGGLALILRRRK